MKSKDSIVVDECSLPSVLRYNTVRLDFITHRVLESKARRQKERMPTDLFVVGHFSLVLLWTPHKIQNTERRWFQRGILET